MALNLSDWERLLRCYESVNERDTLESKIHFSLQPSSWICPTRNCTARRSSPATTWTPGRTSTAGSRRGRTSSCGRGGRTTSSSRTSSSGTSPTRADRSSPVSDVRTNFCLRSRSVTHSGAKMNSKVESSDSDLRSFVSQFNRERERERERER